MASRAIAQAATNPRKPIPWLTIALAGAAGAGIASGVIPKKEKAWRKAALGGSVLLLGVSAILFWME
jgi:hypothetical protein